MNSAKKVSLTIVALLTAVSGPALAIDTPPSPVLQVEYQNINTTTPPNLFVQLADGVKYQATATFACDSNLAPSLDTVKVWVALAQAALLSGKNLIISYNMCSTNPTRWIFDVTLTK